MSNRHGLNSFVLVLSLIGGAASAQAPGEKAPTLGGGADNDITCVPEPEAPAGHFVCEDPDSFARCQALQGKGMVLVEGENKPVPVVECRQGG